MNSFVSGLVVATTAALIGDVARATMLAALMDGRALTAGELAREAGVAGSTASAHLGRLVDGGLLLVERQGRHRYFRLASGEVAQAVEGLMAIAAIGPVRHRPVGPKDAAMRAARACYDHLAGRLGTMIADSLQARGYAEISEGSATITHSGRSFLEDFGLAPGEPSTSRRPFCRACLDWSERRPHLAGWVGKALLDRSLDLGWVVRVPAGRVLRVTPGGRRGYAEAFGIAFEDP